jgi:hypothetical protein
MRKSLPESVAAAAAAATTAMLSALQEATLLLFLTVAVVAACLMAGIRSVPQHVDAAIDCSPAYTIAATACYRCC